jgi:hypothetical protein
MPFLQFLERLKRYLLILAHIYVPIGTKLLKLLLLDLLHVVKLFNVGNLKEAPLANTLFLLYLFNFNF